MERSLGQLREVERAASGPRRQPRQARSAQRQVLRGGRLVLHVAKRARGARHGTRTRRQRRFEAAAADRARCRWRGASANCVRWSAPRVGRADNRAKHAARRDKCSVGGRLVLHVAKRARGARHGTRTKTATTVRSRSRRSSAVSVERSLGQLREVERAASGPRRQPRQARSAQRQVLCGRSAGSPRGGARARRAPRDENETATTVRSRSRRGARCRWRGASANCVRWSAPRVGRADNRAKHAARRDKCSGAVGWFSTWRSARVARATGRERDGNDGSKPQPPTERGVGGEEPRPTA